MCFLSTCDSWEIYNFGLMVVRCGGGVGLLRLKAKSEGTAKVQQRDIEAIASKLKD